MVNKLVTYRSTFHSARLESASARLRAHGPGKQLDNRVVVVTHGILQIDFPRLHARQKKRFDHARVAIADGLAKFLVQRLIPQFDCIASEFRARRVQLLYHVHAAVLRGRQEFEPPWVRQPRRQQFVDMYSSPTLAAAVSIDRLRP